MVCIFYNMPCFYFTVETEMFPDLFATSFTLFKLWFVWSKMRFGLYALPFTLISKYMPCIFCVYKYLKKNVF